MKFYRKINKETGRKEAHVDSTNELILTKNDEAVYFRDDPGIDENDFVFNITLQYVFGVKNTFFRKLKTCWAVYKWISYPKTINK